MLETRELHAYYGKSHVLRGVSVRVAAGEIVSLVGRNGVGRSTLCKAIMGLVPPVGQVFFDGEPIQGLPPYAIAQRGVGYVPEDRAIFPGLSVAENLALGRKRSAGAADAAAWHYDAVYARFPALKQREHTAAEVLSGGEQQMLATARTLMGNPRCIIVDEPTEGLAPKVVEEIATLLTDIAADGLGVLLVEQKLNIALRISSRLYVMGEGRIVFDGTPQELHNAPEVRREWLEV
jgi:branched-chain amino acid transport system ATP-binding protein